MVLIALALAAAVKTAPDPCSWSNPGRDPYNRARVVQAVDDFTELSPEDRASIKTKMAHRAPDDFVIIKSSSIKSDKTETRYEDLRDMHSGHKMCHGPVTMKGWSYKAWQSGLVYCGTGNTCVVVPIVCNNVALLTRIPAQKPEEPIAEETSELQFDAPALGQPTAPVLAPGEDKSFASVAELPPGATPYTFYAPPGFGGGDVLSGGAAPKPPKPPASVPSNPCRGLDCGPHRPPPPPISAVPEPSGLAMLLIGLCVVFRFRRRLAPKP